jgi:hypothetical protein
MVIIAGFAYPLEADIFIALALLYLPPIFILGGIFLIIYWKIRRNYHHWQKEITVEKGVHQ